MKLIHLNPNAAILEKRFDRIARTILSGAESSIETNERPRRPDGSFDYSLKAKYLEIKGMEHSHKKSKHQHFSKTPSHRLTREHLDVPIDEEDKFIKFENDDVIVEYGDVDGDGQSGIIEKHGLSE